MAVAVAVSWGMQGLSAGNDKELGHIGLSFCSRYGSAAQSCSSSHSRVSRWHLRRPWFVTTSSPDIMQRSTLERFKF